MKSTILNERTTRYLKTSILKKATPTPRFVGIMHGLRSTFQSLLVVAGLMMPFGCGGYEEDCDDPTPDTAWYPENGVDLSNCEDDNLCVPFLSQNDPMEDPMEDPSSSNDCGPATLLMVDGYIFGETPTFVDISNMTDWMVKNVETYNTGDGTTTSELAYTSMGYLGLPAEAFEDEDDDVCDDTAVSMEWLYGQLSLDSPVLISTFTQNLSDEVPEVMTDTGALHFMVLVGMTKDENGEWQVVLYDPAQPTKKNGGRREFSWDSFLNYGWDQYGGVMFMG